MTDEELVVQVQNNNEEAENELFSRYKDLVTKISRGYFIVGGELEDLVQEGMFGLSKAIKKYTSDRKASFKTFAITCIKHQIQNAIKRANANKNKALSNAVSLQEFSNNGSDDLYLPIELVFDTTPAEEIIEKEDLQALNTFLKNSLSKLEYNVLVLYLQGNSYKEISQILNITEKSIDNSLARVKTKIRVGLKTKKED